MLLKDISSHIFVYLLTYQKKNNFFEYEHLTEVLISTKEYHVAHRPH